MPSGHPSDPLAPGRRVGKYQVVRRLATGGMAEIYLARARGIEGFEKHVVLKRILPQYAESETFVKLFLNEARVAATLDHANIASVYDIDQSDGTYFFTMEYLHGEDVGFVLRELARRKERLPMQFALNIISGAAAGLHAAHEKRGPDGKPLGIVHRDVSPSNIVVTYSGGVKVVDFGIAKITAHAEMTGAGTLKGKIPYMAPEQCRSEPLDRRSDVFSLGVLLYETTTQTRLFRGDTELATIKLVLESPIPPPSTRVPNYPPALEAVVMKALARNREERYSSARDLQVSIEGFARSQGLLLSSADLGEWMERAFGPKEEPWLNSQISDDADPAPSSKVGSESSNDGATRITNPSQVAIATATTATVPNREGKKAKTPLIIGAALALGAASAFFVMKDRDSKPEQATQGPILVLPEQGQVALENQGGAPGAGNPPAAPKSPPGADALPAAPTQAPSAVTAEKPERKPKKATIAGSPRKGTTSFTASFARRKGGNRKVFSSQSRRGPKCRTSRVAIQH